MIAPEGVTAEREDFRAVVLKGRLAARRRVAMPGQVLHGVTKPEHPMGRPFRAWDSVCDGTQGVALGCRLMPLWGGRMRMADVPTIFAELPLEWLHEDGDVSLPVHSDMKRVISVLELPFTDPETFWKLP